MLEAKLALIEVLRKFSFVRAPGTEVCVCCSLFCVIDFYYRLNINLLDIKYYQ